jgi:hypothetical protein
MVHALVDGQAGDDSSLNGLKVVHVTQNSLPNGQVRLDVVVDAAIRRMVRERRTGGLSMDR